MTLTSTPNQSSTQQGTLVSTVFQCISNKLVYFPLGSSSCLSAQVVVALVGLGLAVGFWRAWTQPGGLTSAPPTRPSLHRPIDQILTLSCALHSDDDFEYRHVILPKALVKYLPTDRLATEDEWRGLGIRQSPGWEHYLRHGKHRKLVQTLVGARSSGGHAV